MEVQRDACSFMGRAFRIGGNEKGVQSWGRPVKGQREQPLPKRELARETENVRLRIEVESRVAWLSSLRIKCLIYPYTKKTSSDQTRVSLNGLRLPRCKNHVELNTPATLHPRLCHCFVTGYRSSAVQPLAPGCTPIY